MRITKAGTVTILDGAIYFDGFEFDRSGDDDASCKKGAILATLWAIGQAQEQLSLSIEVSWGGGNIIEAG